MEGLQYMYTHSLIIHVMQYEYTYMHYNAQELSASL